MYISIYSFIIECVLVTDEANELAPNTKIPLKISLQLECGDNALTHLIFHRSRQKIMVGIIDSQNYECLSKRAIKHTLLGAGHKVEWFQLSAGCPMLPIGSLVPHPLEVLS